MSLKPELIVLDATECRERALLSVDGHIIRPEAPAHGLVLRNGLCSLRTDSGVNLLHIHLKHVTYKGPAKAHLDIELEHGSLRDALAALRRASGATVLECDLDVDVSLFNVGWFLPARHSVSIPLGSTLGSALGFKARVVREATELLLPAPRNLTTAVDMKVRLELSMPGGPAGQLLSLMGSAPVQVKAGVTFAEEGIQAVEAHLDVDNLLQHRTEGSGPGARTVFTLPAQVAGHGDGAAVSAMLSATFAGGQAELSPQSGEHYRIRPSLHGRRPEHSIVFVAGSPKCPLARALGAVHRLRLQSDEGPGAPTLMDSLGQARRLLERKLSGATLEGYELHMHERLFLDDCFAMRVDLDVRGGDLAQPAMQVSAGLILRMAGEEDDEDFGSSDSHVGLHGAEGAGSSASTAGLHDAKDAGNSTSNDGSGGLTLKNDSRSVWNLSENGSLHHSGDMDSGNSSWQYSGDEGSGDSSWQYSGDMDSSWEYSATAVALTARMTLDIEAGTFSGDFAETLVIDRTESRQLGGEEHWAEGMRFDGPVWEHEVTQVRARGSASYDGAARSWRAGFDMGFLEFKKLLVGIAGMEYNWTDRGNNPSQAAHEPLPLLGHGRRLLEAASKVGGSVGDAVGKAAGAMRRLAERFEDNESHSVNVSLDTHIDLDGAGDGSVFDFDLSLKVLGELTAQCNWTVVEVSASNYTHEIFLDLQTSGMAGFSLGSQLEPTASGEAYSRIDSAGPYERVALDMGMTATAAVVTDFSSSSNMRLHGSLSILPQCAVTGGQEAKLQSLEGLNVSLSSSNPQCRQCSQGGGSDASHELWPKGVHSLHAGCGEDRNGSSWGPAASCCVYELDGLAEAFEEWRMSMGSTWRDHFSFEMNRSDNLLDVFGWLENDMEIPQVAEGLPKRMNATYSMIAGTTVRTWLFFGDDGLQARVELSEEPRQRGGTLWGLAVWEGTEKALEVSLEVVNESGAWGATFREAMANEANVSSELRVLLEALGERSYSFGSHARSGGSMERRFGLTGAAAFADERFDASVAVYEAEKLGSAELVVEDPEGLDVSVRLTLRDPADQQAGLFHVNLHEEATDRVALRGFLEDAASRKASLEASAESLNGGDTLRAEVQAIDENGTVKFGFSGSLTKSSGSGVVDALVSVDGDREAASVRGSLPKVRGFYVGDVAVTIDGQTQLFWVNCSEGWLPSAPKFGLAGFERVQLAVGAIAEATQLNLSAYLEAPPFGGGLSGWGLAVQVEELEERRQRLDTSIDLELPFQLAGLSEDGTQVRVVPELVQEVSAEVVLADVTAFDAEAYRAEMARAANIDLTLVEIESVEYKVEVEYTFPEAVTEAEAKEAVAMANAVDPSQVTVVVTDAERRLLDEPARRLQSVDVQATIQAESAASVDSIKTTAESTTALSDAFQATANRILAPAVKAAPTSKVAVVTKMHSTTAPVLDAAALQTLGTAVGGTVEVTDVHAATVMTSISAISAPVDGTTTPGAPSGFTGVANCAYPTAMPLVPSVVWLLRALAVTLGAGGRASF